ncbi:hypothetical protein NHP21005_09580 [Helicobacter sp. NHP21005]|uniref:BspA family leucine-rich repeat surface protein n=1 Tax=Helicobacter felistomachi TaxID=3040201 RepID=UPI0025730F2B|nr:BspA family leucine-rich repeat surface protein [Helicobacter sp. NHP21005]BEG57270.1 hypothetical protein NHP21005_09580 [Helicobacter sp. NHP21005]
MNAKKEASQSQYGKVRKLEKRKAQLIFESRGTDPNWENILNKTSNHKYLCGYVGFLLDFSKDKKNGKENLEKFEKYATLTMNILNVFFLNKPTRDLVLFQKALLCFGDYSITVSADKNSTTNKNQFFGNRFEMYRFRGREPVFRIFEKNSDESQRTSCLRKLLDSLLLLLSPQEINSEEVLLKKIEEIVSSYINGREDGLLEFPCKLIERTWWEQLFLKEDKLFAFINNTDNKDCGRIWFDVRGNHEVCRAKLLQSKIRSENSRDLLGYALYCYCKHKEIGKLISDYKNDAEVQFTVNGFAISVDSEKSIIKFSREENQDELFIKLERGIDIFKEFERIVEKIQEKISKRYFPKTNEELKELVKDENIHLGEIDVSAVEYMGKVFEGSQRQNFEGLESWDVSKVTNMRCMFRGCSSFNQPLDKWDVSRVKNMEYMFSLCPLFDQSLNNWNVSNVENMWGMFLDCANFNQPLERWNVSNVENMEGMFHGCSSFNQPLNNWDVSKVTNMVRMFHGCSSFNQPLDKWDVSNVTYMGCISDELDGMFFGCTNFNQPLNNWDVSKVTDMSYMFFGCTNFNQPLEKWDVSQVNGMSGMFAKCTNFNQPLENWDVSRVTDMSYMFANCENFNCPLDRWDVSNVEDMESMFYGCDALKSCLNGMTKKSGK